MTRRRWRQERDLESLKEQLAKRLNCKNAQFLFTADLMTGKNHCSMDNLVDCLFECCLSDLVHGDKSDYLKLAMSLLEFLDSKLRHLDSRGHGKKCQRPASPPTPDSPVSDTVRRSRDDRNDVRHEGGYRPCPWSANSSTQVISPPRLLWRPTRLLNGQRRTMKHPNPSIST
jgi:hypothetical protein